MRSPESPNKTHIDLSKTVEQCRPELEEIDRRIQPGTTIGVGETIDSLADMDIPRDETPREAIERLARDMNQFVADEKIERLVVVNISSTEPAVDVSQLPASWAELDRLLDQPASQGGQSHFRGKNVQSKKRGR